MNEPVPSIDDLPDLATTAEVAAVIRRTPDYVSRQCAAGNIRGTKVGEWRIARDEVRRFMSPSTPVSVTRPDRKLR